MFEKTSKIALSDKPNTFERSSYDGFHFWWQARHFGDAHMHFQTCGVACFFASRSGTAASSGGKLQMSGRSRQTQYIVEILFSSIIFQGLVNVPFWEYWTSPYSSHYRPYT